MVFKKKDIKQLPIDFPNRFIAYARVSTTDQKLQNQFQAIETYARNNCLNITNFYSEVASTNKKLAELEKALEKLQKGDALIIYELSRIGRSIHGLHKIVDGLFEKGVVIHITSLNMILKKGHMESDLYVFAFSLASQLEKDLIQERTKSALIARKALGLTLGRKKGVYKLDNVVEDIKILASQGFSSNLMVRILKEKNKVSVCAHTIRRFLKKKKIKIIKKN